MMFQAVQNQLNNKFIVFKAEKNFNSVIFGRKIKILLTLYVLFFASS